MPLLHRWLGLLLAAPLLGLSLTGGLLAFAPELERILWPDRYSVAPAREAPFWQRPDSASHWQLTHWLWIRPPQTPQETLLLTRASSGEATSGLMLESWQPYRGELLFAAPLATSLPARLRELHAWMPPLLAAAALLAIAALAWTAPRRQKQTDTHGQMGRWLRAAAFWFSLTALLGLALKALAGAQTQAPFSDRDPGLALAIPAPQPLTPLDLAVLLAVQTSAAPAVTLLVNQGNAVYRLHRGVLPQQSECRRPIAADDVRGTAWQCSPPRLVTSGEAWLWRLHSGEVLALPGRLLAAGAAYGLGLLTLLGLLAFWHGLRSTER